MALFFENIFWHSPHCTPEKVDHVPGKDLGAVGIPAPGGHEEGAEGRVAPQLEAVVAEVSEVVADGASQVEGADEAAVGQVEEQEARTNHPEGQPTVVLLLLGAALGELTFS